MENACYLCYPTTFLMALAVAESGGDHGLGVRVGSRGCGGRRRGGTGGLRVLCADGRRNGKKKLLLSDKTF